MGMSTWEHEAERDNVIFRFSDEEKRSRKESLKKDFPVCNSAMYFTYVIVQFPRGIVYGISLKFLYKEKPFWYTTVYFKSG